MPLMRRLFSAALLAALLAAPSAAAPAPQPEGPWVGRVVAAMIEQGHYSRRPVDAEISRRMLLRYLEAYDYGHLLFLKPEVDDFEARFGSTLGERLKAGDLRPAYEIFERFLSRLEERERQAQEILASTPTFTADESMPLELHKGPWPAGEAEARDLWRKNIKYEALQARLDGQKPEEQAKTVLGHYDNLLTVYRQFDGGDVVQVYLSALCEALDPHSEYMGASQQKNFDITMRLSLTGIGAVLRPDGGLARVVSLVPGGPADKDKQLKPNDRIEAVAQGEGPWVEAAGMRLDHLVELIRGRKGTTVRLRIIPADAIDPSTRLVLSLVRDEIRLKDQEARARLIDRPGPGGRLRRIGVIDLPSFYADMSRSNGGKSTTRDVERLLESLQSKGIDALVLDLRRNGGGALNEALALTGLFLPAGPAVQVREAGGRVSVLPAEPSTVSYAGPLVVLTSRASASASEILAAALQDYGRAVVVGAKSTFGKGTVQAVIGLKPFLPPRLSGFDPGALRLTTQKFYRVSGGSTQNRGVIPDIRLPSLEDELDVSESSMTYALPYDEIPPAGFARLGSVDRVLPRLKAASARRAAASPEFGYVREDLLRLLERRKEKSVSLNEAERRTQMADDKALETRRKKERQARPRPKEAVWAITLDDLAGKPEADETTPPSKSTGTAEGYEKAPPAPDIVLEESVNIA
ncbi:MAG TPA: tail-specific protease, partial [Elusimicrobia bacterium]|nr:tail-specific protease [Elusimicrobiota bacterium]